MDFSTRPSNVRVCQFHHSGTGAGTEEKILEGRPTACQTWPVLPSGFFGQATGGHLGNLTPEHIALGLTTYVVLLFSLSVHESAHAWMAWKLGDETAMRLGRVSLNPIVHSDPIGTRLFPLIQIFTSVQLLGRPTPTPYNPANFRRVA